MIDRRALLKDGSALALGAMALGAVASGGAQAEAAAGAGGPRPPWAAPGPDRPLLPDPAATPVPADPPFPRGLTRQERQHLETFRELDFDVFSSADWARLGESHAPWVRVHWPDGHYTDGLETHTADLAFLFSWAPDTRIREHPVRLAKNEFTAVTGVMRGTFSRPRPDGRGGTIAPTGRSYAINMATVGIWNRRLGVMDEEFLFWDDRAFNAQIGLA